jgi:hypothetical protein
MILDMCFLPIRQPARRRETSPVDHGDPDGESGDEGGDNADRTARHSLTEEFDGEDESDTNDLGGLGDDDSVAGAPDSAQRDGGSGHNTEKSNVRVHGGVIWRQQHQPNSSVISYNPADDTFSISREGFIRLLQRGAIQTNPGARAIAGSSAGAEQTAMDLLEFDLSGIGEDGDEEQSLVSTNLASPFITRATNGVRVPWLPEQETTATGYEGTGLVPLRALQRDWRAARALLLSSGGSNNLKADGESQCNARCRNMDISNM